MRLLIIIVSVLICVCAGPASADGTLEICNSSAERALTICNYPRHQVELDSEQQKKLRKFARDIVEDLQAGKRIELSVIGHADYDAKGEAFQMQISQERAKAGADELKKMVEQEAERVTLPQDQLRKFQVLPVKGMAARQMKFPKAINEPQRKANRRVEFSYVATGASEPHGATPEIGSFGVIGHGNNSKDAAEDAKRQCEAQCPNGPEIRFKQGECVRQPQEVAIPHPGGFNLGVEGWNVWCPCPRCGPPTSTPPRS